MTRSPKAAVRRLAVARLISITGGAAAFAALNFTIYERTRSAAWLAVTLLLTFGVNGLVMPLAGAIGDRFDRRRVMIASDLFGAAAFFGMAFADDPVWLVGIAFVASLVETPFWTASQAAIPNLVSERDLSWANGMIALGRNAGIMIGPALGGALLPLLGPGGVFAANAVSFVISAGLVMTVRGRFSGDRSDADEHRGIRAGFVFVRRSRVLRSIVLGWLVLVVGLGVALVADVPFVELFDAGAVGYGVLIACWGGGSVLGSLSGRFLNERNEPVAMMLGFAIVAVTAGVAAGSPWFGLALLAILVMGLGDGLTSVAEQGILQRRTPDAVRSRVVAAQETVVTIGFVVGLVGAGFVLDAFGPRVAYGIGAVTAALGALVLLPVLPGWRRPSEGAVTSEAVRPAAAERPASVG